MDVDLDSVIDSIFNSNAETPQLLLKSWLDQFYASSKTRGISSSQLIKMIMFVCNSPTLAMTTRLYITEKCLFPNEYITKEVIDVVIRQLGTATAISDSKFQVPEKIQVSLCKWFVHVFFLVSGIDGSTDLSRNGSIWLHLWQFDFLQHWITYIILWSTTSPKDVKRWKVILLGRVGSKPNYQDSQACATLILKRFESITGKSELLGRTITNLRCNRRRLKSLQDFKYDEEFIARLRIILLNHPLSNFSDDVLDELLASSLEQLKCNDVTSSVQNLPFMQEEGSPLLPTLSLAKLASQWDTIVEPLNVEPFLGGTKKAPCHFYLLSLSGQHRFWSIARKWVNMKLGLVFRKAEKKNHNKNDLFIIREVIRACEIYDSLFLFTLNEFFNADCLTANPSGFLLLFTQLFSLPVSKLDHQVFSKNAMLVMAASFLDQSLNRLVFPSVVIATLRVTRNQLNNESDDWVAPTFELIRSAHEMLVSTFSNAIESRLTVIALMNSLKNLLTLPQMCSRKVDLKSIIAPPEIIRRQLISDDPLLLDACCHYLTCTRNFLLDKSLTNTYVKFQNDYILDLTNYLWRNKIVESKKFLGVPSEFLRAVIDNLYLPGATAKTRNIFSITGVPALSYASVASLRRLETAQDVSVRLLGPLTEENLKAYMKSAQSDKWMKNVSGLKELKIEILRFFNDVGPYNHVATFLFTYLKSLSQYSSVM